MSRHAVIKLSLRAEIGNFEFRDIVQYVGSFAMNTIPVASLMVAVGRNVDTGALATIHEAVDEMQVQLPAKVFLTARITSRERAIAGIPNDVEIKIFEGDVVGTGWRRTPKGAHFTVHLLHWLGHLNYASAVSASSHPGNPADLVYPAIFRAIGPSSSDPKAGLASWVPMLSKDFINDAALQDIWGNVLHRWMTQLASDDPFDEAITGGQAGGGDDNTLDALERMVPNPHGAPLNVNLDGANSEVVSSGVRQALINESGGNFVNTTLWGKLIGEWAPAYWFSVIPRVTDALVVPFTGGLQGTPWAEIGAGDYNQADINSQLHQVLRGVGILHPVMFASGVDMQKGAVALTRGGFAGWYQPDTLEKGMIMIKSPPKWLTDPMIFSDFSSAAEGIDGQPVVTANDPVVADGQRNPARDFADTQRSYKRILDLYAQQWYVIEALKGRTGELSGKLRFDIAPGSNVLIKAGHARNVEDGDEIQEDVFATISQVSYVINAENQRAGTAYSLAHIRSALENTQEGTSIAGPPLYQDRWVGAALVTEAGDA